jgi:GntR family transcriptional regulator, arabinose operon transcriptional repressor
MLKTRQDISEQPIRSTRLKYQQVKDYFLKQISDGHLKSGDVLPPEKVLAERLDSAVHTIRHALSELTEERIVRRVQGTGTIINGGPRSDPRKKLDAFGLVVAEVKGALYSSLIKGFIESAADAHHQVLTCNAQLNTDVQGNMILQLIHKNVAGMAIVPTISPMPGYQFDMLRSHGIPVVFCHRRSPGLAAPLVTWPFKEVGRRAGEAIVEHGHRRVAFVAAGQYVVSEGYLGGLRDVLARQGVDLPVHRALYSQQAATPPAEDDMHHALTEMLTAPDRPTAVFCSDAIEGERVFLEAVKLRLRVPQDLSIVGFGCVWRDGVLSQRLAAVTIDEVELGRRAAALLDEMRTGLRPLDDEECVLMPVVFSEGETLGPAPAE